MRSVGSGEEGGMKNERGGKRAKVRREERRKKTKSRGRRIMRGVNCKYYYVHSQQTQSEPQLLEDLPDSLADEDEEKPEFAELRKMVKEAQDIAGAHFVKV